MVTNIAKKILATVRQDLQDNPLTWRRIGVVALKVSAAMAAPVLVLAAALYLSVRTGFDVADLMRDMASVAHVSSFTGMFTLLGGGLWGSSAVVCFLGWWLFRKVTNHHETALYFLWAAVFSAMLYLDDMFLLHEEVLWENYHIGERQIYTFYILFGLFGVTLFYKQVLKSEYLILAVAVGFLGLSVAVDALREVEDSWDHVFEEAPKWFGIAIWWFYWMSTFVTLVKARLNPPASAG